MLNRAPTAAIRCREPGRARRAVEFTAAASDPDGDGTITKREWDVDGDGFDDGEGASKSVTFSSLGSKSVRFRVTDDGGDQTIASKSIAVLNRAPDATVTGPATGNRGQALTFTAHPTDPDGAATIAKLEWDTDGDGFDDGEGASLTARSRPPGSRRSGCA